MAASVAKSVQFKFGTHGTPGTPTDRSTYFDDVKFPRESAEVETTAFGNSGNRTFLPGLKGATFTGSGFYDGTIGAHIDAIYDGLDIVNFEYGPVDGENGSPKYTGTMFVTNFEIGAAVGEKIPFSVTFRVTSTVTLGTYGA